MNQADGSARRCGAVREVLGLVFLIAMGPASCGPQQQSGAADVDETEGVIVVTTPVPVEEAVRMNVYLDGTVSMSGYVADGNSNYLDFIQELETSQPWKHAEVHYYKFGSTVTEIPRPKPSLVASKAFYGERVTQIDSVIDCKGQNQVAAVVTDLFQDEGDIQAIVARIKQKCFLRATAVGILAIPSQFDGVVYDAKVPPFPYQSRDGDTTSYRPFYVLLFGEPRHLASLVQGLASRPYISENRFVLISNHVVRDYTLTLTKTRDSKDLNVERARSPRHFVFRLRKGGAGGRLDGELKIQRDPLAPPFRSDQLQLSTMRFTPAKGSVPADSAASQEFQLEEVTEAGTVIKVRLNLNLSGPPDTYLYRLTLRTGPAGFGAPRWVTAYSSSNPTATSGPNKTLNLDRFISALRRANSTITRPAVAQWFITVRKL